MIFLEEVYKASKLDLMGSNVKVYKAGKDLNLNIEMGNNFNWCESGDEEEQAISLDENLIELFKLKDIEYSDKIESDFFNLAPNESFETYLKDESGTYSVTVYIGHLDVDGISCLNHWIDFNNIVKL